MAHAARLNDPIGHSPTMSWLLAGVIAAAAIAVTAVAVVGNGGLAAAAIIGGAAAAGGGSGEILSTMSWANILRAGEITAKATRQAARRIQRRKTGITYRHDQRR